MNSVREILDAYAAELRDKDHEARPGTWIFRRSVDHEAYAREIDALIQRANMSGRKEGAASLTERLDYQCACRCRVHTRHACPKCQNVEQCPVHNEADPKTLRPEFLKDPESVARALYLELAASQQWSLDGFSDEALRRDWIEAARKIVTSRIEGIK